jgi:hypothetical protein
MGFARIAAHYAVEWNHAAEWNKRSRSPVTRFVALLAESR